MVNTYMNAIKDTRDIANGLTRTHQGGQAYEIRDPLKRLARFLVLGSANGSYYQTAEALTAENIAEINKALSTHGIEAIDLIVSISNEGRAPKNDEALFALAVAASYEMKSTDPYAAKVRKYALDHLSDVARTGTHLIQFCAYVSNFRGWGVALRRAVANWFNNKSALQVAHQVTKYPSRKVSGSSWAMADLLRLSHASPSTATHNALYKYVVDGIVEGNDEALTYVRAAEQAKRSTDVNEVVGLIQQYSLPREVINTELLREPRIWEALLFANKGMPMTAMIRNLGTMTEIGLIRHGSNAATFVADRLTNEELIQAARIHPIDMLKAKLVYQSNGGQLSSKSWKSVQRVTDALEDGFYKSFKTVVPSNKRLLLAVDVSSSMTWSEIGGVRGFTPRVASACLAMVAARTEPDYHLMAFSDRLVDVNVSKHDSLASVVTTFDRMPFGGTDCALPMKYAAANNLDIDAFLVYTDSDTGGRNPSAELRDYRRVSGIHDSKLIVNGMVANRFSIADPSDLNMLDLVGFDSATPQITSAFIRGEI